MRRLLLDTNVVVWLLLGERASVTDAAREALEDESNSVSVSAVSVWEIAIKRSLGKLDIEDGWMKALERSAFDPMPITAIHAEHVERLPWLHRDPFDRMLIAQASTEAHALVSAGPHLAAYGVDVVW
ncbi:MAG: type II toxin-antitoxin system VapC family toxin [Thermoleophilaceae bacterium]|nr:type II toxin-antitoxin system VapC family toxin [Thermoleophilaceae bacterium]